MKYALILAILATACTSAPAVPTSKSDSTLVYEWSEGGNHFYVRKIKIDGQEYIMASTSQGVAITPHLASTTINGSGEMASPWKIDSVTAIDTATYLKSYSY